MERVGDDGRVHELRRYEAGEIFGELSLVTGLPRTASIVANEETVVLELTQDGYERLMNGNQSK